jgi:protein required for attachment to host cells
VFAIDEKTERPSMNTVWILVCDAARARLFEIRNDDPTWHVCGTFDHMQSRRRTSELAGDHLGQRSSEGPSVHHSALAPASSPKEIQKGHFGHSLATMLDQAMRSQRFDRWVLVAPPHFLGMLKNELTLELQKHLVATIDKDLIHLDIHQLSERLRDAVRVPADQPETVRQAEADSPGRRATSRAIDTD